MFFLLAIWPPPCLCPARAWEALEKAGVAVCWLCVTPSGSADTVQKVSVSLCLHWTGLSTWEAAQGHRCHWEAQAHGDLPLHLGLKPGLRCPSFRPQGPATLDEVMERLSACPLFLTKDTGVGLGRQERVEGQWACGATAHSDSHSDPSVLPGGMSL